MRTITMQTIKDGKLSGEILEDGKKETMSRATFN